MTVAIVLALGAAALLGLGAVVARIGVRHASPRAGAAISVPITTLSFWLCAPLFLRLEGATLPAALLFAAVGLVFPASVTLLNFEAARRLGPSITSALGTTTALFSALFAIVWLHERPSAQVLAGTLVIVVGLALVTFRGATGGHPRVWLLLPLAAAMIRAGAQATIKHGLTLWSSPFAASLLSYTVSATLLIAARPAAAAQPARPSRASIGWFSLAGFCNGGAVVATYAALASGPVTLVVPLATTAPLFALLASALILRDEIIDARLIAGVVLTVSGAAVLVAG